MTDKPRVDAPTGTAFVGHEWDGIEELDTPMPRWWLFILYASIVFAIGYCIAYPAWPLIDGATKGILGWSSTGQLQTELSAENERRAPLMAALRAKSIDQIGQDPKLLAAAVEGGRAAFKVHCVQCHGSGAAGGRGYPNLNDDDWLWGGDLATLERTLQHGIRQPGDDQTRQSQMPAFGRDGILKADEVQDLASFVRLISRQEGTSPSAARGGKLFESNCAVCHGPSGRGSRTVGAPDLTDQIWLYGGDRDAIVDTITNAHAGVMPAWRGRLDPATIKMLAAYVHSLGGGERSPEKVRTSQAAAVPTFKAGANGKP